MQSEFGRFAASMGVADRLAELIPSPAVTSIELPSEPVQ